MTKKKGSYHHNDLRNDLIEKGIELVNDCGIGLFSLRKVAVACGVSHSAPYSHFKNKDDLLDAMQNYITDQFSCLLENAIEHNEKKSDLLKNMGIVYITFFVDNPEYFQFLYSKSNIKIDFTLSIPDEENYKPYIIYKDIVFSLFKDINCSIEKQKDITISIWAFVHGLASLVTMKNVNYNDNWKQKLNDFLEVFQLSALNDLEESK